MVGGDGEVGEGGQAGGVWRWVRMVSERARAVVGETAKWARAGEHACVRAVVGEGGGGDSKVGKHTGMHVLAHTNIIVCMCTVHALTGAQCHEGGWVRQE